MPSGPVLTLRELDILKKQMAPTDYTKILDQMIGNMGNISGIAPNWSYFDPADFKSVFGSLPTFDGTVTNFKTKTELYFYHSIPPNLTEVPEFAELIEIKKWFKMADEGELEDDDGFGELAREGKSSDAEIILPSKAIIVRSFPKWATHIAWYSAIDA